MNVLIIEDEAKTAKELKRLIEGLDNTITVLEILSSVKSSVQWLQTHPSPDLIFSDIQLGDGLSFDIFRDVVVTAPVIFCTAFDEYAIQAFQENSIDYLLKPIEEDRLAQSLEKYKNLKKIFNEPSDRMEKHDAERPRMPHTLLVYVREKIIPVKVEGIAYIHAANGLVSLVTQQEHKYVTQYNMEQLESMLDPHQFFRANRQFIINRAIVRDVEHYFNRRLNLKLQCPTPEKIIISKLKASDFLRWMEFVVLLFCCMNVFGQARPDSNTMVVPSLPAAITQALKSNPSQTVYQQQIRQAQYNAKASKGAFYPNAAGAFSGTDNLHLSTTPIPGILIGQPGTTYYAQFGKKYVYNTGITLTQNIVNWQAVLESRLADENLHLTASQQASYEQSLKEQVARTYYSILIAQSSLSIIAADQGVGDSLVALAKRRLEEGTGDALSLNTAMISRNGVLQNKALSQQLYDQGEENLKILLGTKPAIKIQLTELVTVDSLAAIAPTAMGADRNLDVYRQQVSVAELQRKAQRSVAYPSLSATGYLGVQQFRDDLGMSFDNKAWSGYRYLGVNLNVPLFTGLTNTYKYRSAITQKDIAELQYEHAADQSDINDRLLMKNFNDYQELVSASGESFQLYGANIVLDKQKFEEGVITMDVYLKAFQDYLTAENTYMNNLSQLLSIKATLISRQ